MTIYDISEKAGVSIATVSRVLNGSSNVVGDILVIGCRLMKIIGSHQYDAVHFFGDEQIHVGGSGLMGIAKKLAGYRAAMEEKKLLSNTYLMQYYPGSHRKKQSF